MTLNNTLYINIVSYFYASVNWLLYINYRGVARRDNHNTRITNANSPSASPNGCSTKR